MKTETLAYQADGIEFLSTLYVAEGAQPRPAALVFPEAFGLGAHAHGKAQRLAEAGCTTLACDLHGGGAVIEGMEGVMATIGALFKEPERIAQRSRPPLQDRKPTILSLRPSASVSAARWRSNSRGMAHYDAAADMRSWKE